MVTRKPYDRLPRMTHVQYLELMQQIRNRSRAPFSPAELKDYLTMLNRAQFILAIIFLLQGFTCLGFTDKSEYMNFCGAASLCGFCGLFGSFSGYLSLRHKGKKILMVVHFILSIVSAVSSLLLVISTSIWTTELAKDTDKAYTLLPFWILLLLAVGQGAVVKLNLTKAEIEMVYLVFRSLLYPELCFHLSVMAKSRS